MHSHATAVLPGTAEAAPAVTIGASARDQWLAKSTDDAAKALRSARDFAREEWPPSGAVRLMS